MLQQLIIHLFSNVTLFVITVDGKSTLKSSNGDSGPGADCAVIPKKTLLNPTNEDKDNCNSITYCKIDKDLANKKLLENFCKFFGIPKDDCNLGLGKCKLRGWMIAIIVLIVLAVVGIGIGILLCVVCKVVCCK